MKKTRIIAMLLTVLMVASMLPLSLFAAAGDTIDEAVKPTAGALTVENIRTEFAKQNVELRIFQSFQNWTASETFAGTAVETLANGAEQLWSTQKLNGVPAIFAYNASAGYSVKTEDDSNKALYLGTGDTGDANDFVDITTGYTNTYSTCAGDGIYDMYISIDFKMGGVNIDAAAASTGLLGLSSKNGGSQTTIAFLSVDSTGALYLGKQFDSEKYIGTLSSDEYTRIAVATDRVNNLYYVYLNGVLVNPKGDELFPQSLRDKAIADGDTTGNGVAIERIRVYNCGAHVNSDQHKGMYMDNFILGTRLPLKAASHTNTNYYTADFSGKTAGAATNQIPAPSRSDLDQSFVPEGVLTFIDDDGNGITDGVQFHKAAVDGNAFAQFTGKTSAGTNASYSMTFKPGADGISPTEHLMAVRKSNADGFRLSIGIDANGIIRAGTSSSSTGAPIGKITDDSERTLRIDIVYNAAIAGRAVAMVYLDGQLVFSNVLGGSDYKVELVRLANYNQSSNTKASMLKNNDLIIKGLSSAQTNAYDTATSGIKVFESDSKGFVETAGVLRYFDANGALMTEDFFVNGEKYLVGLNGNVIGKESDGVEVAPYAPYIDYDHEDAALVPKLFYSVPNGIYTGSAMGAGRDSFADAAVLPGGLSGVIYRSYYDAENPTADHNSYPQIDLAAEYQYNKDIVLDFDIMLGEIKGDHQVSNQSLISVLGAKALGTGIPGSANRADANLLCMDGDGWLKNGSTKMVKISQTEFTRISLVVHTPKLNAEETAVETAASYEIYANGVQILDGTMNIAAMRICAIRYLQFRDTDISLFIKNAYMYEGTKPAMFYTVDGGSLVLTDDASLAAATRADAKQGLVEENGVARYYTELGYPMLSANNVVINGVTYTTNANGKIICDGENHIAGDKGACILCGSKSDAISALYGNNLVLGSDVKVVFYLDISDENASVEYGLNRDFALGTTEKKAVSELETEVIEGKTYYVVSYRVSAKDIAATVKVQVIKADEAPGSVYTYSAQKYIDAVKAMPTDDTYTAELKALVSALEIYGKNASAVLFGEGTTVAVDNISYSNIEAVTAKTDGYFKLYNFSLELKSNIKLKIYVKFDSANEDDMDITQYETKVNGNTVNLIDMGNDIYCIEIKLVAAKLGENQDITIFADGAGFELSISALYYAKVIANADSGKIEALGEDPVAYKNLVNSIKLYSDTAVAYANSIA